MADDQEVNEEAVGYRHLLDINWTEVAENLIKSRLLLTALELHVELVENGRELAVLRDFFSNPGNFEKEIMPREPSPLPFALGRTSSNLTLDSIDDFTRYSDDGLAERGDERIAVLQFELRKAQETIKSLRGSLTEAAEQEGPQKSQNDPSESGSLNEETIKPYEKRAINFLVNEYLLQHGYRLTSVTLSDENEDQDFDDWDDVGLNVPQPPNLLRLYRDFDKHVAPSSTDTVTELEEDKEILEFKVEHLKQELDKVNEENKKNDENTRLAEERLHDIEEEKNQLNIQIDSLTEQLESLRAEKVDNVLRENIENNVDVSTAVVKLAEERNDSGVELSESTASIASSVHVETIEEAAHEEKHSLEDVQQQGDDEMDENEERTTVQEMESQKNTRNRNICPAFKKALLDLALAHPESRVGNEVTRLAKTEESVVLVLSRCLPHIVPNVLLNKREELLPVILCTAIHHPEEKERDKLLHLLVNLIKRPDADQRRMIISGCAAFAHCVGHLRTETELLPQLWEQINHKYPERRQLVAEACGVLAEYLSTEIVSSLVLSMLKQMYAEDRHDGVRATVIKSLALVITIVESPSKYKEAEQLLMQSICDDSEEVREATVQAFLPSLLAWANELDKLQSDLLELLLNQLQRVLSDFIHVEGSKLEEDSDELDSTMNAIGSRFLLYIQALRLSVPALLNDILMRAPFKNEYDDNETDTVLPVDRLPSPCTPLTDLEILFGDTSRLANYLERLDKWLEQEETQTFWESLSWVITKYIPKIYSILGRIHYFQVSWVNAFAEFFRTMCNTFGHVYTRNTLQPFFENDLKVVFSDEQNHSEEETQQTLSSAIIPVFILGVLTAYSEESDQTKVKTFLKDTLISLSSRGKDIRCFDCICDTLSSNTIWCEVLFGALWDLLIHSDSCVRSILPHIIQAMIKNLDKTTITKRVLPALVTLSTDNDKSVRISTVPAFGAIVEHISDDEMLEKIHVQFQSFLSDPSYYDQHELQVALIRTFGKIGPHSEPRFRDDFLHPKLTELVLRNSKTEDEAKKTEVAVALLEAYASLTCCFISEDILRNHTLPGLMYLKKDLEIVAPECEESVTVLMKDCEDKLLNQRTAGPSQTTSKVHEEVKRVLVNKFNKLKVSSGPKMVDMFRKMNRRDSEKSS